MKNWKFGASAKEFERLKEYANQFELLEIYLEQGLKKGQDPIELIAAQITATRKKPYSVHLRYKPFLDEHKDGVNAAIYDLSVLCMSVLQLIGVLNYLLLIQVILKIDMNYIIRL